mmetsp:Transcript_13909/g.23539  ORF Transcript_13909/g.23539 Transcript_13909/m.23539 type:complete len:83 (+) Transcript_13909:123-371(+)
MSEERFILHSRDRSSQPVERFNFEGIGLLWCSSCEDLNDLKVGCDPEVLMVNPPRVEAVAGRRERASVFSVLPVAGREGARP